MGAALVHGYPTEQRQVYRPMRIVEHMKRMEAAIASEPASYANINLAQSFPHADSSSAFKKQHMHSTSDLVAPKTMLGYPSPSHESASPPLGHTFGNSSVVLEPRGSTPGGVGFGNVGMLLSHSHSDAFRSNSTGGGTTASRTPLLGRAHSVSDPFNGSIASRGSPTPLNRGKMAASFKHGVGGGLAAFEDKEWMYNLDHLQNEFETRKGGGGGQGHSSHHKR